MKRKRCLSILLLAAALAGGLLLRNSSPVGAVHASDTPKLYLDSPRSQLLQYKGMDAPLRAVRSGDATAVSLTADDLDRDGVLDLIAGYATASGGLLSIHRGNLDAFAPQSQESFEAIGRGQFPSPFLPQADVFEVPARPDFLIAGHFAGEDQRDLIVATRGGKTLYRLSRGTDGSFGIQQAIDLPGSITAVSAFQLDTQSSYSQVVVGIHAVDGPGLLIYSGASSGLALARQIALDADAKSFAFGALDGDAYPDVAILAGTSLSILHGRDLLTESVHLQFVPVSASAIQVALGAFIPDRDSRLQMAVLAADGSVHFLAHKEFDPRPFTAAELREFTQQQAVPRRNALGDDWKEIETVPAAAAFDPAHSPLFMRTRVSGQGADDVLLIDTAAARITAIAHPKALDNDGTFAPGMLLSRTDALRDVVAALPMRVNVDGRPGLVLLKHGQAQPSVMMPLPDPTFTVNRTDDITPRGTGSTCNGVSNDCTLREAVIKANSTSGCDTIMVPAGTYTLTLTGTNNHQANVGRLDIQDCVSIVGATGVGGAPASTVQAGTTTSNGIDKVFSVNPDRNKAFDTSLSNLVIQFGRNPSSFLTDGAGGGLDWEASNTGNLTITNCTIQNNSTTDGNGGGIWANNMISGFGFFTISNSVIQNNVTQQSSTGQSGNGGGIWVGPSTAMVMSNTQVLNNSAVQTLGVEGEGGGLYLSIPANLHRQTAIHASTVANNHTAGNGGGIFSGQGALVDQSTAVTNNQAGLDGGGIWISLQSDTMTITKTSITGNTATGNGGGIRVDVGAQTNNVNVSYSRIAGNSAPSGSGLSNSTTATVTASDNWWGCNQGPSFAPCDRVSGSPLTTTTSPWLTLNHTASPLNIVAGNTSTLTAGFLQDSLGAAISASNLDVFVGVPITFGNPVHGTLSNAQTTIQASGTATATFTGTTSGAGSATATVDGFSVTANINVVGSASLTTSFGAGSIPLGGTTSATFLVTNTNTTSSLTGIAFTDNLPAGLVVANPNGVSGTCGGGTITAVANSGSISLSGATVAANGSCSFSVNVTGTAAGTLNNTTGAISSNEAGTGGTSNTATLFVVAPPSIAKQFSGATVPLNSDTTLTFTITNPAANTVAESGVAFVDNLPSGMVVSSSPGLSNTCGGTPTAGSGSGSVSLSGASIATNSSCAVSVNITGTSAGVKNNTTGNVSSTNGGTGNTASASITVGSPATISNSFGVSSIPLNGNTTLSFTITNPNPTIGLNNVAFSNSLPSGLAVATPNGLTGSCGSGTITALAGSASVSLSGGTIALNGSCSFTVSIVGSTAGVKNNTTGAVSSTEGGTGSASNTATLTVVAPPTVSKSFGASSVPLNGSTSLTFTVTNPNGTASLSNISFTDSLPSGLTVSNPSNLSGTCTASITATPGSSSISFGSGSLAAGGSCSFSVSVTGTTNGDKSNTTSAISSAEGGTGTTSNTAVVSVVSPPSMVKVFGASNLALNTSTTLTFTITNAPGNTLSETGVAFTDTLPSGLVVATPNGLNSTCGGTPTAVAGSNSISLTGGSVAVNSSCTFVVNVTGTSEGQKNNLSGAVTSTNGGTGNTASAGITVAAPPTISKSFGAASVPVGGSTSLNFTITSVNTVVTLHNVAFTDNLPAGLAVATPNNLTTTCNGSVTANSGATSLSMNNTSLTPGGSCTISLNVTGVGLGVLNNTTGAITSSEGGTGSTSNTATLIVIGPPTIAQAFGGASVPLNGNTTLTFTIMNLNTTSGVSGIGFSDTLPSGLVVSTPNGLTNSCGGTPTANAAGNTIGLVGGVLPISGSCTVVVNVTGTTAGDQINLTGNITSSEGGTGLTSNTATLSVVAPPSMSKAFGVGTLPLNTSTTLTFTITNPAANTLAQAGVAFSDTLPAGLIVATPNGVTQTCNGTVTATAGTNSISLSGGSIPVNSSCSVVVNVIGTTEGQKNNTSGAVSSTNGGTGNTASATVNVGEPATISNAFGASLIPVGGSTSLTFSINNPNSVVTLNNIAFSDSLPSGVVVASPNGLSSTCSGTPSANSGGGAISLSGASLTPGASCTVAINVTGTILGVKANTTGAITSTEGGTGASSNTAMLTVVGPPTISKNFGASSIPLNGATTLTFTLTNLNATVGLSGIAFADSLPGGLAVANPVNLSNTCGGTPTATAGANSVSLTGGAIAAGGSCSIVVSVTGTAAGDQPNTTGAITSAEGGTGLTSNTATLSVVAPPSMSKGFGATSIAANASTTLTFTITNPASNTLAESGVAFTDTLPAGLVVSTPNGLSNTCGGTPTALAGSTSISLTGGSIPVNSSCTIAVNVTGTTEGQKINTSGAVSSTNGGTGNTASATVTVAAPPTITAAFGNAQIPLNGSTSLTFNITSPNSAITLHGVAFTDSLPSGLVIASPSGLTTTCDGTTTANDGAGSLSLAGASLTAGASCTISLNVTGTAFGVKNNATGAITSAEGGTGATSNTTTVTVIGPPTISATFAGATVPLNQSINLTLKVTNPNPTVGLSGISFSDTLPAGLLVSSPNGLSNTCGGTASAAAGTNSISLVGGAIAANANCTVTVSVTGITPGDQPNLTSAVTSTEGGTGGTSNTAILSVVAPATISKAFGASRIPLNGNTSLSFSISNPAGNTVSQTGVAFTDNMPAGLAVSSPSGLVSNCGGTVTATPGSGTVSLTGGTIGLNASCTVTLNVTGTAVGVKNNSTTITSTNGSTGNTGTATITVATPPSIVASFAPSSIPLASTGVLAFTITNPNNGLGLTGVQFSNDLPTGLKLASPSGAINTCGGTLSAAAGATSLSLSSGSIPSNSACTITVTVAPTTAGSKADTSGVISSIESGSGSTSNTAILTVVAPPLFTGSFSTDTIQIGQTATLTLTLTNPAVNSAAETGVAFTDALPAGLALSSPPNAANTCGGNFVAVAGDGAFTLSNGSIAVNSSCTFSVGVTASTGGVKNVVTGPVTSTNGGSGNGAAASINVLVPITVTAPAGRTFTVDGTSYTSAQTFIWDAGSTHIIAAPSPQQVGADTSTHYEFDSWSDGGGISHTVTVPATATTYTAKFITTYALNISGKPDEGGSTIPSSNQYFPAGSTVQLTAAPFACFAFGGWTGQVASSSSLTTSIVMSGPQTVIANFGGVASCGGTGHPSLTIQPTPPEGGTIAATPAPDSSGGYALGANVQLQALPTAGYFFLGFASDLTGTDNPQSLVMDSNKTVFGFFAKIPTGPEQIDFAFQRGNPLPGSQLINGTGPLVGLYPQSGGGWLVASTDSTGALKLTVNPDVANALPDGIYDSYVVTGNNSSPSVIRVRLFVNSLQINSVADSAGYRPTLLSPAGLFTAFGVNLASQPLSASDLPLPQTLSGSTVTITDSTGTTSTGQLLYASPSQINLLTPDGLAVGPAKLIITNAAGLSGSYPVRIGAVAPGLFSADATGKGPAAAVVQKVAADGTSTFSLAADCQSTPGKCVAVPINLGGAGGGVYLSLYGTGIRGRSSLGNVAITIGGVSVTPLYAGLQSQFPGLDQVNVQLPAKLAGIGEVDVIVTIDGQPANVVRIAIQ